MERRPGRDQVPEGRDSAADGFSDNLRLTAEDISRLRTAEAALHGHKIERRWEPRTQWSSRALAEFTGPTGAASRAVVYPFDISPKGIGFFHAAFLHNGTRVRLRLWFDDKESIVAEGTVRRCAFLSGRAHAVGVELATSLPDGVVDAPSNAGANTAAAPSSAGDVPAHADAASPSGSAPVSDAAVPAPAPAQQTDTAPPAASDAMVKALEGLVEQLSSAMSAAQSALRAAQAGSASRNPAAAPSDSRAAA